MTASRPRPIPGAVPRSALPDRSLVNGSCPVCESRVLWALDRRTNQDGSIWHAPLDPVVVEPVQSEAGLVQVLVSSTGEVTAISPQLHRLHTCDRETVKRVLSRIGGLGYYTADVLAIACPVLSCGSAPGMLCLTARREPLPQPHGARKVVALGGKLEDSQF